MLSERALPAPLSCVGAWTCRPDVDFQGCQAQKLELGLSFLVAKAEGIGDSVLWQIKGFVRLPSAGSRVEQTALSVQVAPSRDPKIDFGGGMYVLR